MLKNDLITLDGHLHRVLHIEPAQDTVWLFRIGERLALPKRESLSGVRARAKPPGTGASLPDRTPAILHASAKALMWRDRAWARIAPLVATDAILVPSQRAALVRQRAKELRCSERTLMPHLRQYWAGGQTLDALLPHYERCGRKTVRLTAGRGNPPVHSQTLVYQLTEQDITWMTRAARSYLKDERRTMSEAHQRLREKYYVETDGEGTMWLKPRGQCPSLRQFRYFVQRTYSAEFQARARKGDKEFERDHRAVLGTVMQDCQGIGHYYEIDATVGDVFLVAAADRARIIGKPTVYLVIDRASRLIVGYYVGLENASWNAALLAILSICEDKRALCERLGVEYDPADWPAHGVLPSEFLADRGEVLSEASNQLPDALHVTVTNVPSLRPDWKPLVESGFRLLHQTIKDTVKAYDPPSNATKRRGKHYEKDASLTLGEFEAIVLHAIIERNRAMMRRFPLTLQQLADGVTPSPIALWEYGLRTRMGALARRSADTVRFALLPRDTASVTEAGIVFKGCHYGLPKEMGNGWFVKARSRGRFTVDVSYDPRRVDAIYVHAPRTAFGYHVATLLKRSEEYRGLTFNEVHAYEMARKAINHQAEESHAQEHHRYHRATDPIQDRAHAKMTAATGSRSRSARRADTREDRTAELAHERERTAAPLPGGQAHADRRAKVVQLRGLTERPVEPPAEPAPSAAPPAAANAPATPRAPTVMDKVRQAQRRMSHGR